MKLQEIHVKLHKAEDEGIYKNWIWELKICIPLLVSAFTVYTVRLEGI